MKAIINISALTVLLAAAPNPCFAVWDVMTVSKQRAKELGMEVRLKAGAARQVSVELEFETAGAFKDFAGDRSGIELEIREGETRLASARLNEDRSKPGRVVVSFSADRGHLDKITLRVRVPYTDGGLGGAMYELRMKDFVEQEKVR
jgi:hypothetical protein